jgi:four helix bundle protein
LKTYRDLDVWQEAMNLAEDVCRITGSFPREEQFGLTAQLGRSVMSVPANIAEGHGR